MQWLNINTSTLDSAEFLSSEPTDQATWLKLLRFCIGQENSGLIAGAGDWTAREWQNMVRVTLAEARRKARLWEWAGSDLKVRFYPLEQERGIQAKRHAAITTNAKRTAERTAERPSKEREGKEREAEGKEGHSLALDRSSPVEQGPRLEECLQWGRTANVPEDWIQAKHTNTAGTHGWIKHGQLIDWQTLWPSWFEEDRRIGRWPKQASPGAIAKANAVMHCGPRETTVDFGALMR